MERWYPVITRRSKIILGYEVSDLGNVRSYWTKQNPPTLGTNPRPRALSRRRVNGRLSNWLVVCLRIAQGRFYTYLVHELVAWSYLGPRPSPRHVIIHLNHQFDDNRAANLAWVTRSEASLHAVAFKPRRPLAKLSPAKIRVIRASKLTARELAAKYGVGAKAIYNIRWGKTWADVD